MPLSIEWVTLLMFMTFIALLVAGLPIAWVTGAVATIFTFLLFDLNTMVMLTSRIYRTASEYSLIAVPLFIFMAAVLERAGIAEDLFQAVYLWAGGLRGGLAISTVISCAVMAAMVGVVGAEVVTFGLLALPAMLKRKYDKQLALGTICAGGGLAVLIPPSVIFIIYAMIANCSVGDLFLGGVIPGILLAGIFILYIVIRTLINPQLAPAAPREERNIPLLKKLIMLKGLAMPFVLAVIVLGSIYGGFATPTEAAGVGCGGAVLVAVCRKRLSWEGFKKAVFDTGQVTGMMLWLVFGAQTIIGIYTLAGGDDFVKNAISSVAFGSWGTIFYMQVIWIFLGMFIDWIGIIMLTGPLFIPIITSMGFDSVWFGVVFCMNMQIAYLSPPFGPSAIYLKGIVPEDISLGDIYRSIFPFMALCFLSLILTLIFPQLTLWLPQKIMGR